MLWPDVRPRRIRCGSNPDGAGATKEPATIDREVHVDELGDNRGRPLVNRGALVQFASLLCKKERALFPEELRIVARSRVYLLRLWQATVFHAVEIASLDFSDDLSSA